jgi:hypothetical protein
LAAALGKSSMPLAHSCIASTQIRTMDHTMDAWEEQIELSNAMTASPSAMLSKKKSLPGPGVTASWPSRGLSKSGHEPFTQVWMQLAEHSQKAWADIIAFLEKEHQTTFAPGNPLSLSCC